MAIKQCIGIHYCTAGLTGVVVEDSRGGPHLCQTIKLAVESGASAKPEVAALEQLVDQLKQQREKLPPAALSLASEFYQSQFHHSEFSDPKQLRQTLRFDVEEEFMIEAEAAAICYQRLPQAESGSDLIVHIAARDHLTQVLPEFDEAGIDALIAQPDLASWLTYIKQHKQLPADQPVLLLGRTAEAMYILILDDRRQPILARSYHCNSDEHARATLTCELQRSLALLGPQQAPTTVLYHPDGFTPEQIEAVRNATNLPCSPLAESDITQAFAAGAATAWLNEDTPADFRADHMPPRSLITANRKALFGLSAAISILLLAILIVAKAHRANYADIEHDAKVAVADAWKQTNPRERIPRNLAQISGLLHKQLNELKARSSTQAAQTLPTSAGHILMLLLDRLDTLGKGFDLQIKAMNINVKAGTVILSGAVPNLEDMEQLVTVFTNPQSPLAFVNWEFDQDGTGTKGDPTNKVAFTMPLRVRAGSPKASSRKTQ